MTDIRYRYLLVIPWTAWFWSNIGTHGSTNYSLRISDSHGWCRATADGTTGWGYSDKYTGDIGEVIIYGDATPEPSTFVLLAIGTVSPSATHGGGGSGRHRRRSQFDRQRARAIREGWPLLFRLDNSNRKIRGRRLTQECPRARMIGGQSGFNGRTAMTTTIEAVYEGGVFRPTRQVCCDGRNARDVLIPTVAAEAGNWVESLRQMAEGVCGLPLRRMIVARAFTRAPDDLG